MHLCVLREIDVTHKCTLCFIFSVCIKCMLFFVPLYSICYLNTNPVFIKCDLFFPIYRVCYLNTNPVFINCDSSFLHGKQLSIKPEIKTYSLKRRHKSVESDDVIIKKHLRGILLSPAPTLTVCAYNFMHSYVCMFMIKWIYTMCVYDLYLLMCITQISVDTFRWHCKRKRSKKYQKLRCKSH